MPRKPSVAVLDHAGVICPGIEVDDGELYRPANSTEGMMFEEHWCSSCKLGHNGCRIYASAFCGEQPSEWHYWGGKPLCRAWKDKYAPKKPRKRKPTPTPLLDWMAQQDPQPENSASWIDSFVGIKPETKPDTSVSSQPVERPSFKGEPVTVMQAECPDIESTSPDGVTILKEWRWWPGSCQWTYTGFMGMNLKVRSKFSRLFPVNFDPNLINESSCLPSTPINQPQL